MSRGGRRSSSFGLWLRGCVPGVRLEGGFIGRVERLILGMRFGSQFGGGRSQIQINLKANSLGSIYTYIRYIKIIMIN